MIAICTSYCTFLFFYFIERTSLWSYLQVLLYSFWNTAKHFWHDPIWFKFKVILLWMTNVLWVLVECLIAFLDKVCNGIGPRNRILFWEHLAHSNSNRYQFLLKKEHMNTCSFFWHHLHLMRNDPLFFSTLLILIINYLWSVNSVTRISQSSSNNFYLKLLRVVYTHIVKGVFFISKKNPGKHSALFVP